LKTHHTFIYPTMKALSSLKMAKEIE